MSITVKCGRHSARYRLRLGEVVRRPNNEHAMVQGQLDEVEDDRPIMQDKGAARSLSRAFQVTPVRCLSSRRDGIKG